MSVIQRHSSFDFEELIKKTYNIAAHASEIILGYYLPSQEASAQERLSIQYKKDDSPVTQADIASHNYICEMLSKLTPDIPIVSEEGIVMNGQNLDKYYKPDPESYFWLVDPLDGTKEFISGSGDFSVNIGLVYNNKPILGIMTCPIYQVGYIGGEKIGAWKISGLKHFEADSREEIVCKVVNKSQFLKILASKSPAPLVDHFLMNLKESGFQFELNAVGSARKFGLIAEGLADLYPRYLPCYEWDTAAAQAIIEAAGGLVLDVKDFSPLTYQKEDDWLNSYFLVSGSLNAEEKNSLQQAANKMNNVIL